MYKSNMDKNQYDFAKAWHYGTDKRREVYLGC